MGTIMDYLKWRGDLTFSQSPFNEIDNLILASFSYVNLDGISEAAGSEGIFLPELSDKFMSMHSKEELDADKSFIRCAPFMMEEMAKRRRFQKSLIKNYVNEIEPELEQQFCAVEILLEDGSEYVSFRGTDDTIVGWKEDFNLSTGVVPAQKRAVEYLNAVGMNSPHMLRVGGHSKGGNLAVYGAVLSEPEVRRRILQVYTNDGPGFSGEFLDVPEFDEVLPKIIRIIPEYSIIGTLLSHKKEPVMVVSSNHGVLQHDSFSWQVEGPAFVTAQKISPRAAAFGEILHKWIDDMDTEQKAALIDDLFDTLMASGSENLSQIQEGGLKSLAAMLHRIEKFNPESRIRVQELLAALASGIFRLDPSVKLSHLSQSLQGLHRDFLEKALEKSCDSDTI